MRLLQDAFWEDPIHNVEYCGLPVLRDAQPASSSTVPVGPGTEAAELAGLPATLEVRRDATPASTGQELLRSGQIVREEQSWQDGSDTEDRQPDVEPACQRKHRRTARCHRGTPKHIAVAEIQDEDQDAREDEGHPASIRPAS